MKKKFAWVLDNFKNLGEVLYISDRPVLLASEAGLSAPVGFNTPKARLFFSLSPDLCLQGRNVGKNKRFVKDRHVIRLKSIEEII